MTDDPVLDAAARVLEADGFTATPLSGLIIYEWLDEDGTPCVGSAGNDDLRDVQALGLIEWAKAHLVDKILRREEL